MMLVSVLMPVKNAATTVIRAANSILQQTHRELELIIINDHSTDNTAALLQTLTDSRVILAANKGQGIAAALNTGLCLARGAFIARMDADDYSLPDRLAKQLHYAHAHPDIGVISCLVKHNSNSTSQQGYGAYINRINQILSPEDHYHNRFADAPLAHPSAFYKASLVTDFGNYTTEAVPEDFELWLRWLANGVKFAKVPEVLLHWADPPQRASRTLPNYKQENFYKLKAAYFYRWWQKHQRQRQLWIWGYGKQVFRKVQPLADTGVEISGYIDIKERPGSKRNVRHFRTITKNAKNFYLVYLGDRQGKEQVAAYFNKLNMQAGEDYLFMA